MEHQLWKAVPTDILHLILKYDGRIVERNGIYMNRIPLQDERYEMIKNIAPKKHHINSTFVWFPNSKFFIGFIEQNQTIKLLFFKDYMSWETYLLD